MKTPHRSACLGLFALILQAVAPLSGMPAMQGANDTGSRFPSRRVWPS